MLNDRAHQPGHLFARSCVSFVIHASVSVSRFLKLKCSFPLHNRGHRPDAQDASNRVEKNMSGPCGEERHAHNASKTSKSTLKRLYSARASAAPPAGFDAQGVPLSSASAADTSPYCLATEDDLAAGPIKRLAWSARSPPGIPTGGRDWLPTPGRTGSSVGATTAVGAGGPSIAASSKTPSSGSGWDAVGGPALTLLAVDAPCG